MPDPINNFIFHNHNASTMSTLFNGLTAVVVTDANGSRVDFFSPSGNLHHSVEGHKNQPVFGRQKWVMHEGTLYTITWRMTPQTPSLPR